VADPGYEAEAAGYSYVFAIRKDRENVDSMYFGNKIRFANHSSDNDNIICKTVYSQGTFYMGLYAKRDIAAGEELFLNYNYPHYIQAKLVAKPTPKSNNTAPSQSK
jgi:SET domain-containing protein